jgi:preprotein translocase subunit Sec61beta
MAAIQVSTVIKTVTRRAWHDIEPKVLAFLATGVSAGLVVEAGDYAGIHVNPSLAVLISTIVAAVAGYIKKSTSTAEIPAAVAPADSSSPSM